MLQERVHDETREMLEVRDLDPQQVVHVAGERVAPQHFRPVLHRPREGIGRHAAALLELHVHEGHEAQAHLARLDQGDIAADHARGFQRTDAAKRRAGRQAHAAGDFEVGQAAFALQDVQDLPVGAVEGLHVTSTQYYCATVPVCASDRKPIAVVQAYDRRDFLWRTAWPRSTTRWAPTASSSSSTPPPIRSSWGRFSSRWASPPWRSTARRT